ncbi:MAG: TonB-dependent receptor [Acidobacteria bacterium]|nr:TonB-dependent receptor [Acidobacteriota bacterium]
MSATIVSNRILFTASLILLSCPSLPLLAQETRGQILGRVRDQSGAVVAGVTVTATNAGTNIKTATKTNATGDYVLPFLNPGVYGVTAEQTGFKTFIQDQVQVRVSDMITLNINLELGMQTQSVRVTAEAPMIESANASLGQVIDHQRVTMLPLKDGAALMLANLSPGVLNFSDGGWTRPYDDASISRVAVNGSRGTDNEYTLDGASNSSRSVVAYVPPPDVIQEFKIQTAGFDASLGNSSGATINLSLKSGTNDLHGSFYYFIQNPILNANKFFSNKAGLSKAVIRENRWGLHATGPVTVPGLYKGRDRTFWMYGYEGIHEVDPRGTLTATVPAPAQRQGDFSGLLALGSRYQIYDPFSTTPAASGRFARTPIPGNILPKDRINPTAQTIMGYYDSPRQPGTSDGQNNWADPQTEWDHYFSHIFRIDHNLSAAHRIYFRGDVSHRLQQLPERFNLAVGSFYWLKNHGLAFDHVWTAGPQFLINTRYSYTRNTRGTTSRSLGMDLSKLNFSPAFLGQLKQFDPRSITFPAIAITGYSSLGTSGLSARSNDVQEVVSNLTRIIQNHTLRFGLDFRDYREGNYSLGQGSGTFTFGNTWMQGPLDNSPAAPMGQGLASFLLGLPTSGGIDINGSYAARSQAWAGYLQDDWKITSRLTLNLGLRYEVATPATERYNRTVLDFDFNAVSPIQAAAQARYAQSPIKEVPVSDFKTLGGLRFAGVNGLPRGIYRMDRNNFMPRLGFAYQLNNRTVLRGGAGVFFGVVGIANQVVNQTGFSRRTDFIASVDNGQHFIANLSNPFPDGKFDLPQGAGLGLMTEVGSSVSFFNTTPKRPYTQRWQFSVQREMLRKTVLEMGYIGSKTVKLPISRQFDPTPARYLSTSPLRDQATIDYLSAAIPNPFYPLLPRTSLSGVNATRGQLLRPYPQFTGVSSSVEQGYSWYHSLQTRLERRFDRGFTVNVSWTWSKLMDGSSYLNATDSMPERVPSDQDRTHRITISDIYELPFGKGKKWGGSASGIVQKAIGGWQIQSIFQGQSGAALGFGNAILFGDLKQIPLPNSRRAVERWFNVGAGFERDSNKQLGSNIRTMPSRFSGIRGDGINMWDYSVIKRTRIKERLAAELRAEFCNALNHPQFSAPNTTPTSTAFGTVTAESQWPRTIQFGLKLTY